MNNDNKELNDNLERLFASIKNSYDISGMIRDIKEKEVGNKKNYEILSYEYNGQVLSSENSLVHLYQPPIHSVKRSDSEIFSRGDKTIYGIIESFTVEGNWGVNAHFTNGSGGTLSSLTKVKDRVPILKTEDGEEVFEGDETVWVVDKCDYEIWSTNAISLSCTGENKYFSTKEKAKIYIDENKPCLSYNNVITISEWYSGDKENQRNIFNKKRLKELAQKKINNQ